MSFDFNYKLWVATKNEIKNLVLRQNVLKKCDEVDEPAISFRILAEMYVLYSDLATKLGILYQNTYQVQKREVVKKLMEPIIETFLTLKTELKNLELSEYVYVDNVLVSQKLTPTDLVIWRSPNFLYRRPIEVQNILYDNELLMNDEERQKSNAQKHKILSDALTLIQAHEKARQARVYKSAILYDKQFLKIREEASSHYTFSKKNQGMSVPIKRSMFSGNSFKRTESCQNLLSSEFSRKSVKYEAAARGIFEKRQKAACVIQCAWRKYRAKKICYRKEIHRTWLYGAKKTRVPVVSTDNDKIILDVYRKEMYKRQLDEEYMKLMTDERVRLLQERGPQIMEDITDHVRAWFMQFYKMAGNFHPYPEVAKQGTVLVLIDESMTLEEFNEYQKVQAMSKDEQKARAEKLKEQKKKERDKIKKNKMKEAKRRKKLKDNGIFDFSYILDSYKHIGILEEAIKKYSIEWKNVDEYLLKNDPVKEWVTESELAIIHKELRGLVDEYMRLEHELLKEAWCIDNNKPYKAPKPKPPKPPKTKKKKADPLDNRSINSIYEELNEAKLIEKYPHTSMNQFIGEFNLLAEELRSEERLVTLEPTPGDFKFLIEESILGYGAFNIEKPKSLCVVGPENTGKIMICKIIACDTDALVINLSPEKTYPFANNIVYLVNLVMKLAKTFQPTILYIHEAHRVFAKSVPKEEQYLCPTILQGLILKKIMKGITKQDKIMLLGTSTMPWAANPKFKKAFERMVLVPQSNYGTAFLLWLELISQDICADTTRDYICSALAKVLSAYNTGDIVDSASNILTLTRKTKLHVKALNPEEFLEFFLQRDEPLFQPDEKIMKKYLKWYSKTNQFLKMRNAFLQALEARKEKKK